MVPPQTPPQTPWAPGEVEKEGGIGIRRSLPLRVSSSVWILILDFSVLVCSSFGFGFGFQFNLFVLVSFGSGSDFRFRFRFCFRFGSRFQGMHLTGKKTARSTVRHRGSPISETADPRPHRRRIGDARPPRSPRRSFPICRAVENPAQKHANTATARVRTRADVGQARRISKLFFSFFFRFLFFVHLSKII